MYVGVNNKNSLDMKASSEEMLEKEQQQHWLVCHGTSKQFKVINCNSTN